MNPELTPDEVQDVVRQILVATKDLDIELVNAARRVDDIDNLTWGLLVGTRMLLLDRAAYTERHGDI